MRVDVKICGLTTAAAVEAAAAGGAAYVGFNFFPASPRYLPLDGAAALAAIVPPAVKRVAVLVDPDDASLATLLQRVPLDLLQLHGDETPERVAAVRHLTGKPVIKAIAVASSHDLDRARLFEDVADLLMFDAAPPGKDLPPGGNAWSFDWALLAGRRWAKPWLLAGGLTAANVVTAIRVSGARLVDVSSGVEERRGVKNSAMIAKFLATVAALDG
ncbi:MAG: phosphoribosylanthranilate isomerase [Alphaproteobacteria bacterium]|nr:phosphoribosylanthranilate isomerase [Alphaproteobacteria bacterium]